jgi:hypothetical protein
MKAYLGELVTFLWAGAEMEGAVQAKNNGGYWIKAGEDMYRVEEAAVIKIIKWSHERHSANARRAHE